MSKSMFKAVFRNSITNEFFKSILSTDYNVKDYKFNKETCKQAYSQKTTSPMYKTKLKRSLFDKYYSEEDKDFNSLLSKLEILKSGGVNTILDRCENSASMKDHLIYEEYYMMCDVQNTLGHAAEELILWDTYEIDCALYDILELTVDESEYLDILSEVCIDEFS